MKLIMFNLKSSRSWLCLSLLSACFALSVLAENRIIDTTGTEINNSYTGLAIANGVWVSSTRNITASTNDIYVSTTGTGASASGITAIVGDIASNDIYISNSAAMTINGASASGIAVPIENNSNSTVAIKNNASAAITAPDNNTNGISCSSVMATNVVTISDTYTLSANAVATGTSGANDAVKYLTFEKRLCHQCFYWVALPVGGMT